MVAQSPRLNLDDLFAEELCLLSPQATGSAGSEPAVQVRGIGATASVATLSGPVPAADLRVGGLVLTRDGGYAAILSVETCQVPMTRVPGDLFRATQCGPQAILVAATAGVLLADDRFPVLFGTREVLVAAGRLGVATEDMACASITLAVPALIAVGHLWIEVAGHGAQPRPMLSDRESAVAMRLVTGAADITAADIAAAA